MANKKTAAVSADSKNMQTSEFKPLKDTIYSVSEAILKTLKNDFHKGIHIAQPTNPKNELRKAISDAVRDDAEESTFTSVKETKQRRRDIIFNTIMKHARNLDS